MSLPWNRSVRLHLDADEVSAVCRVGWPRAAAGAEARCSVASVDPASPVSNDAPSADPGGLAQAVRTVLQDVATQSPAKGASVHVELSNALLHLDVVEGDFGGCTDRQLADIAAACAAEILGPAADDHEVRSHLQRDGRRLLIAAIGRPLLSMLSDEARACGMRLASATPEFVAQWNAHGRAVKPGECVFAVSAPRDLAIATTADGAITSISVGPPVDLGIAEDTPAATVVERAYALPIPGLLVNGPAGASRGVFSPSRPESSMGADALDIRVDRMLVAHGRDPEAQATFVLVAPGQASIETSARWSIAGQRSTRT